jgi:hypothetical protein
VTLFVPNILALIGILVGAVCDRRASEQLGTQGPFYVLSVVNCKPELALHPKSLAANPCAVNHLNKEKICIDFLS